MNVYKILMSLFFELNEWRHSGCNPYSAPSTHLKIQSKRMYFIELFSLSIKLIFIEENKMFSNAYIHLISQFSISELSTFNFHPCQFYSSCTFCLHFLSTTTSTSIIRRKKIPQRETVHKFFE